MFAPLASGHSRVVVPPQQTGPAGNTVCLSSSPRPRCERFRRPLGFGQCPSHGASSNNHTPPSWLASSEPTASYLLVLCAPERSPLQQRRTDEEHWVNFFS